MSRISFDAMHQYHMLLCQFGPQGWWPMYRQVPDDTLRPTSAMHNIERTPCPKRMTEQDRFQVCVGAILTQNTAWTNVERAFVGLLSDPLHGVGKGSWRPARHASRAMRGIAGGERNTLWTAAHFAHIPRPNLARLIHPAGYFNQKAKKLHIFSRWLLRKHDGSLAPFLRRPTTTCRTELLSLWGIGPETADSILLYAGRHPVFVIDAYTKRFLAQHNITFRTYDEYQRFFMEQLPRHAALFNEYHALIVVWGKHNTRKTDHHG